MINPWEKFGCIWLKSHDLLTALFGSLLNIDAEWTLDVFGDAVMEGVQFFGDGFDSALMAMLLLDTVRGKSESEIVFVRRAMDRLMDTSTLHHDPEAYKCGIAGCRHANPQKCLAKARKQAALEIKTMALNKTKDKEAKRENKPVPVP